MGFNARQCNAARGAGSLEAAVETALALDESNVPAATSWHTQGVTEPPATEAQAASLSTESPPSESPEPTVSGRCKHGALQAWGTASMCPTLGRLLELPGAASIRYLLNSPARRPSAAATRTSSSSCNIPVAAPTSLSPLLSMVSTMGS